MTAPRYRWYVLAVCVCVYVIQHIDRQVITLLLEPIGQEFALTDSQRGLLAGLAFAVPFAIAGLPIGLLIDRVNRVRLLSGVVTIWSGMTALSALAGNFWQLLAARVAVGAAESGGTPTNIALIADYFSPKQRATALGIYYTGPHIGTIIGFSLAGAVAAIYGWRAAFLVVGLPGLLLAAVVFFSVREPQRGASEPPGAARASAAQPSVASASGFGELFATVRARPLALHVMLGTVLLSMSSAGLSAWLPALLIREYGLDVRQVGLAIAFAIAPCAILGSIAGGRLHDYFISRGTQAVMWLLLAVVMGTVLSVWLGLQSSAVVGLLVGFAVQHFFNAAVYAPANTITLSQIPIPMRGRAMALVLVASNVVGYGVGVQLVGLLSDGFRGLGVSRALLPAMYVVAGLNLWTALHFGLAARRARAASE